MQVYAEQALKYYRKCHDEKSVEFLIQAKTWLKDELANKSWAYDLKPLHRRVDSTIEHKNAF